MFLSKISWLRRPTWVLPLLAALGIVCLTSLAVGVPEDESEAVPAALGIQIEPTVAAVNAELEQLWKAFGVQPTREADELTIYRRLSLALHGTIPSLEELRLFYNDTAPDRLQRWTSAMLDDSRFDDYFAERLARAFVGVSGGQFLVYRRDRFLHWLSGQLREQTPYDVLVRSMVTGSGIWTGRGEVNFLTAAFANDQFDADQLAARTVRAFLGQRIDCAQCHDHPFDHWKQNEFEGLAAFYGQLQIHPLAGVYDDPEKEFTVADRTTLEDRTVSPSFPFEFDKANSGEDQRQRLANWITHSENQRFEIATANRVWALLFGRPFDVHRPVDDLPDPGTDSHLKVLEILGRDFREHDYDLRRLIQVIVSTHAFRMDSRLENPDISNDSEYARDVWAVFPLVRLRPEQVIGSMLQSNSLKTIDQNSHLFTRAKRYFEERDFVNEFGDPGVNELQNDVGTIPQALLRMNGEFAKKLTEASFLSAPGRLAVDARSPEKAVELAYLVCLTRFPKPLELNTFAPWFKEKSKRSKAMEDLFWILFNSPEFSWNH